MTHTELSRSRRAARLSGAPELGCYKVHKTMETRALAARTIARRPLVQVQRPTPYDMGRAERLSKQGQRVRLLGEEAG